MLGVLALPVIAVVATAGLFGIIIGGIKGSDAYDASYQYAASHPAVIASLGTPVEDGFLPSGSVTTNGAFGESKLSISLSGPRGKGSAHVIAERNGTDWVVTEARLQKDGRTTDITPAPRLTAVHP